jgi:hypothetical protein
MKKWISQQSLVGPYLNNTVNGRWPQNISKEMNDRLVLSKNWSELSAALPLGVAGKT